MAIAFPKPPPPGPSIPPLENGDHLSRDEFERRYAAMPGVKKAELIEGIVYVPSPVHFAGHSWPHQDISAWIAVYRAATPGLQSGNDGSVRLDLDHGADVNARNDHGVTPLHIAASPEMVEVLLRNGADLEARSKDGCTPLMLQATEADSEDVMEALLEAGADPNARTDRGNTALGYANSREEPEKAALLRRWGARS